MLSYFNQFPLPPTVPIIPTFLYAMEHPSPEPQTAQPSVHPLTSFSAPHEGIVPSQLPPPSYGSPVWAKQSQHGPRSSSLLMSAFNNDTFILQETQTDWTPSTESTDQTSVSTDLQINETSEVEKD